MPFNGSGTFTHTTSGTPVVTLTTISSTMFNDVLTETATGLSTCIAKDGQTATTARIPFASGINSSLTTDATSGTTGSIISAGGISCQKALFVGTDLTVLGDDVFFGGQTSSHVRLKRSGTNLTLRLGDDSDYAAALLRTAVLSTGDIYFAGQTASEVALIRSTTTLRVRLGDNSAAADIEAGLGLLTGSDGLRFVGATANDVRINKNGNFTLRVQKGDGSGLGNLECANLTPTSFSFTFGGFSGSHGGGTYSDGFLMSVP